MVEGQPLILVLYVDDLILTRDEELIYDCERDLAKEFKMKDIGLMPYFLGLEVWQGDGQIFLVLKFGTGGQVVPLGFDLWPREKCPKEFNFSPKVTL